MTRRARRKPGEADGGAGGGDRLTGWAAQAGVKVVTEAGLTLARVDTVRQCQC